MGRREYRYKTPRYTLCVAELPILSGIVALTVKEDHVVISRGERMTASSSEVTRWKVPPLMNEGRSSQNWEEQGVKIVRVQGTRSPGIEEKASRRI